MLLEQSSQRLIFRWCTSVNNPKGGTRNRPSGDDEYVFFLLSATGLKTVVAGDDPPDARRRG